MIGCSASSCGTECTDRPAEPTPVARRIGRILALAVAISCGVAFICVASSFPRHRRERRGAWAMQRVSRWSLRALGVRLVVEGAPRSGPSLVVGNHVSWLDILALSASAPMRMVGKAEVGRWPVIGLAARRAGTLFLHRERLRELPASVADMAAALRSGDRIQVFPEGTTRCGGAVNPFRRAAFQAAIDAGVVVSPVTVRYVGHDQKPTSAIAFVGDETLADSMRRVLAMPSITVRVVWLPAIPAIAATGRDYLDRAEVARLAENAVSRNLGVHVLRQPIAIPRRQTSTPLRRIRTSDSPSPVEAASAVGHAAA